MADIDLQEEANFTRLSRLLVDKGTEALRNAFDGIHSPARLPAVLAANRKSLLRLKFRVIDSSQWDLLYPPSSNPTDSKTFDVTLLTVLFRNICNLPSKGWDATPVITDKSLQANIIRIKSFRNDVYAHATSTKVDNATFESLWKNISQTLVEMNIPQTDIDYLKACPLGPEEAMYVEILKVWRLQDEDCMKVLVSVENSVNRLTKMTNNTYYGRNCSNQNDDVLLQKLAKHNFKGKIRSEVKNFQPGTREWLFKDVDEWFIGNYQESKTFLLTAGPGFGKSVFAAKICENFRKKGKLAACHFCDFNDSNLRNPMMMLQSLTSQMCENLTGFKEKLLDQLKRPYEIHTLKNAFQIYLQNPLDDLEIEQPSLVVIDGLDESAADDKNEIVNLIADYFPDLSDCIKFLVTSRPENSVTKLKDIKKVDIESKNADNDSDLEIYLGARLPHLHESKADSHSGVIETLVKKCEGSFLYAYHAQSELKRRDDIDKLTLLDEIDFFPKGLDSVYHGYFRRLEDELKAINRGNLDVLRVLEMLVASLGPLPLVFVTQALGLAPDCRETKAIINKVKETLSCLLYVSDETVTIFHKSVIDWLLARSYKDHEYTVTAKDGNKSLWLLCEQTFEKIKKTVLDRHDRNMTYYFEWYALKYGFGHLLACDMKERFPWLVDVTMIYTVLFYCSEEAIGLMLHIWKEILIIVHPAISDELRARITWHIVEIEFIPRRILNRFHTHPRINPPLYYLQSVLTHSPKGYFTDDEKEIAKSLLSDNPRFVDHTVPYRNEAGVMPLALWSVISMRKIKAVGLSNNKKMVAVAQNSGIISMVCVPRMLELWQYTIDRESISCCTFAQDDSLLLFGKLETALDIAQRKEVPFFRGNERNFKSCEFSPNGKKLITSNGSSTIMLWDVAKQSLISYLRAGVPVNWCSFNRTGQFIMAYKRNEADDFFFDWQPFRLADSDSDFSPAEDVEFGEENFVTDDSFCVWNAFTLQRSDERMLSDIKDGNALHSKLCKRCIRTGFGILPTYRKRQIPGRFFESIMLCGKSVSTGIFNDVECSFVWGHHCFNVIENAHCTALASWNCFSDDFYNLYDDDDDESDDELGSKSEEVIRIENDQWLYSDRRKLIFFKTSVPIPPTTVLWSSFSPDGSRLATCTSDGCINIWNVHTKQVEQRFRTNQPVSKSPFVCWWSEKFLFVFDFFDGIPSLWKYPVDVNSNIHFTRSQKVSMSHLVDEFTSLSEVVDLSGGLLFFKCDDADESKPVKVIDVNAAEGARVVTLPGVEPMMSISVSPGASFVFGGGEYRFYIWKRNEKKVPVYKVICYYSSDTLPKWFNTFVSNFSSDSKVAVVSYKLNNRFFMDSIVIDLDTGNSKNVSFCHSYSDGNTLCINKDRIVIVSSQHFIRFFDMDSGALLGSFGQRHLINDFIMQTKLSPNETVLVSPEINGNMKFLCLSIPQKSLLCNIKREAAIEWGYRRPHLFTFDSDTDSIDDFSLYPTIQWTSNEAI